MSMGISIFSSNLPNIIYPTTCFTNFYVTFLQQKVTCMYMDRQAVFHSSVDPLHVSHLFSRSGIANSRQDMPVSGSGHDNGGFWGSVTSAVPSRVSSHILSSGRSLYVPNAVTYEEPIYNYSSPPPRTSSNISVSPMVNLRIDRQIAEALKSTTASFCDANLKDEG